MGYPYQFVRLIGNVGVGVENLGFERPSTLPAYDGWMRPRYQVRGCLDPNAPGFVKHQQHYQPVGITGNGIALQGQFELQKLAEMTTKGGG